MLTPLNRAGRGKTSDNLTFSISELARFLEQSGMDHNAELAARAPRREAMMMGKRQQKQRNHQWARPKGRWTRVDVLSAAPRQKHPTAAERESRFEAILTALEVGDLSRDATTDRLVAELSMDRQVARDEVDGFLRD